MTGKQFLDMVKLMRKAQKEYLKSRSTTWMVEAKRLERMVDTQIEYYDKVFELTQAKQLDFLDKIDSQNNKGI